MRSEDINCKNNDQLITWLFPMSPSLIQHQRNTSNMIVNSANSAKCSKDDFGVRHIFKNGSTVARYPPFSHQNGENTAYNGADNGSDDSTNVGMEKGDGNSMEGRVYRYGGKLSTIYH